MIPLYIPAKKWLPMVSKWCERISSIHSNSVGFREATKGRTGSRTFLGLVAITTLQQVLEFLWVQWKIQLVSTKKLFSPKINPNSHKGNYLPILQPFTACLAHHHASVPHKRSQGLILQLHDPAASLSISACLIPHHSSFHRIGR